MGKDLAEIRDPTITEYIKEDPKIAKEKVSFGGIAFYIDSITIGHKKFVEERAGMTNAYTTSQIGTRRDEINIKGFISGGKYLATKQKLISALSGGEPKKLIMPMYGEFTVIADTYTITENFQKVGMATIEAVFLPSSTKVYSQKYSDYAYFSSEHIRGQEIQKKEDFQQNFYLNLLDKIKRLSRVAALLEAKLQDSIDSLFSSYIGDLFKILDEFDKHLDVLDDTKRQIYNKMHTARKTKTSKKNATKIWGRLREDYKEINRIIFKKESKAKTKNLLTYLYSLKKPEKKPTPKTKKEKEINKVEAVTSLLEKSVKLDSLESLLNDFEDGKRGKGDKVEARTLVGQEIICDLAIEYCDYMEEILIDDLSGEDTMEAHFELKDKQTIFLNKKMDIQEEIKKLKRTTDDNIIIFCHKNDREFEEIDEIVSLNAIENPFFIEKEFLC